jgi:hypothetical protein
MDKQPTDLEFRIMPNGNGRWYWELISAPCSNVGFPTLNRKHARTPETQRAKPG